MKQILALVIIALPLISFAQNVKTATIQWNSQRTFNVTDGQSTEESTTLTNHGSGTMEWKNADGSVRKNFQIVEAIGEWANATVDGRVQFEVTDGQTSGTVSLQRKNQETKILIVMASEPPQLFELVIQSIQ